MQKIGFSPDTFEESGLRINRKAIYESLIEIRFTEEMIAENYKDQQMRTAIHLGTGQEGIATGVCANLQFGDAVFSHHRSHNHFLASGGSVFRLIAELHGSQEGCSKGRGGSVHLNHSKDIFFVSTAILGECVSLAVGRALAYKMEKRNNVSVAFFGDAVWEEGVIYESLNFAAIHSLPTLFICENNLYSTESTFSSRKALDSEFTERARSFGVEAIKGDGNNVREVFNLVAKSVAKMRIKPSPILIELDTYRWREHVGPNFDHDVGRTFRSKNELEQWKQKDPVRILKKILTDEYSFSEFEINEIDQKVLEEVSEQFLRAKHSPKPEVSSLFENAGDV
jgi:TPP-dependent pyruvate/acetoin dehydrogenase alpha subunit